MDRITKELVQNWLPLREPDAHKGDFGRVLMIAGSKGMMGACVLSCRSAFRSGSGLVAACCSPDLFSDVHAGVPEATCVSREGVDPARYDAVAIGPGLGVSQENHGLICRVLAGYEGPAILDADALNCLAKYGFPAAEGRKAHLVLTPHAGEAAKLLNGPSSAEVSANRETYGLQLAERLQAVTVMKGSGSLICCPDGSVFQNTTGNAGMATGGSGDVLTGMICSFAGQLAAQGAGPAEAAKRAAVCGVYLHGLAGDLAAKQWGTDGLMASDLADYAALARESFTISSQTD
ncbi:MAG: NAD(P)H-hydrate dehydratase [Firmicutes bacterium]|nr:NAD(P)H-hydrate dehydratase [Bacillota bacterium]